MASSDEFIGLSSGFYLHAPSIPTDAQRLLDSPDAWEVLWGIVLSCRLGDFGALGRIAQLMRTYDNWLFWAAASELAGCAGQWSFLEQHVRTFQDSFSDRAVQLFLSNSLAVSCGLWAVEPLLKLHAVSADDECRYHIESQLSHLLEPEYDRIWMGAKEETITGSADALDGEVRTVIDFDTFASDVRGIRDTLALAMGDPNRPVFEGIPFDVVNVARRLHDRINSERDAIDRIDRERILFEANTGIDTSGFYDKDGGLRRLHASAAIEDFLESDAVGRFQPGQRYFFGHAIEPVR